MRCRGSAFFVYTEERGGGGPSGGEDERRGVGSREARLIDSVAVTITRTPGCLEREGVEEVEGARAEGHEEGSSTIGREEKPCLSFFLSAPPSGGEALSPPSLHPRLIPSQTLDVEKRRERAEHHSHQNAMRPGQVGGEREMICLRVTAFLRAWRSSHQS